MSKFDAFGGWWLTAKEDRVGSGKFKPLNRLPRKQLAATFRWNRLVRSTFGGRSCSSDPALSHRILQQSLGYR